MSFDGDSVALGKVGGRRGQMRDEQLIAHLTSPSTHLSKRYRVTVARHLEAERLRPLEEGLTLDGAQLRPAEVHILGSHQLELVLTEGKYHQVKRMLGAVGYPVQALQRVAIGQVTLDIAEGKFRELRPEEIQEALGYMKGPS